MAGDSHTPLTPVLAQGAPAASFFWMHEKSFRGDKLLKMEAAHVRAQAVYGLLP